MYVEEKRSVFIEPLCFWLSLTLAGAAISFFCGLWDFNDLGRWTAALLAALP